MIEMFVQIFLRIEFKVMLRKYLVINKNNIFETISSQSKKKYQKEIIFQKKIFLAE